MPWRTLLLCIQVLLGTSRYHRTGLRRHRSISRHDTSGGILHFLTLTGKVRYST